MEIERKFTLMEIPEDLDQYEKKEIEQGYLCSGPVVRVRKSNDDYILTYKSKPEISAVKELTARHSNEVELALTKEAYDHLKSKTDGYIVEKTRYLVPLYDGLIAEVDIFKGRLDGLYFAEVEFDSEDESISFRKPEWFKDDVTFDIRYKNSYLSTVTKYDEWGKNI